MKRTGRPQQRRLPDLGRWPVAGSRDKRRCPAGRRTGGPAAGSGGHPRAPGGPRHRHRLCRVRAAPTYPGIRRPHPGPTPTGRPRLPAALGPAPRLSPEAAPGRGQQHPRFSGVTAFAAHRHPAAFPRRTGPRRRASEAIRRTDAIPGTRPACGRARPIGPCRRTRR